MGHLSNDHQDSPNQHENSRKLYHEMGHHVLSLTESQWKLRQKVKRESFASVRNKTSSKREY